MWADDWIPLTVIHHLAMFGGYWNSASESTKYSICHVATQNHMIEGSCNFMSGNSSLYITTLLVLEVIGIVVVYICS